jgi:hypothetical protein
MLVAFLRRQAVAEVERVGDAETEVLHVEIEGGLDVLHVEAEVAEPADAERALKAHAADDMVCRLCLVVHQASSRRFLRLSRLTIASRPDAHKKALQPDAQSGPARQNKSLVPALLAQFNRRNRGDGQLKEKG